MSQPSFRCACCKCYDMGDWMSRSFVSLTGRTSRPVRPIFGRIPATMIAKLILRNREYEVKAGMTLLDALKKSNIVPESVIATRDGEMITEDEILRKDDVVKLIAVISGGS